MPIGRFMLEEACARAAAWEVAGHRVGVSVKVSAHQLDRDGFATDVRRALQQSGIEPSLLTLEIPETAMMRDLAAAAERLRELKALGVSIAIDDFGGSGYAHQADLRQLAARLHAGGPQLAGGVRGRGATAAGCSRRSSSSGATSS